MAVYNDIINNVDARGLNNVEIARLLYIELGKRLSFSTKFQNTDELSFAQMFSHKLDVNKFDNKEVNCVQWSIIYDALLTYYGVPHEMINQGHHYIEFYDEKGVRYVADATDGEYTDLSRIHNGDVTNKFGICMYQPNNGNDRHSNTIPYNPQFGDYLVNLDQKLGINLDKRKQLEDLLKLVVEMRSENFNVDNYVLGNGSIVNKKLQLLFAKMGTLDNGYYEAKDFLRHVEYLALSENELANVSAKELKRTNADGTVDIVQVITVKEDIGNTYYLVCPGREVMKVSHSDIIKLASIGFGKDEKTNIPGIIFPNNFVPGQKPVPEKFTIKSFFTKKIVRENSFATEMDNYLTARRK